MEVTIDDGLATIKIKISNACKTFFGGFPRQGTRIDGSCCQIYILFSHKTARKPFKDNFFSSDLLIIPESTFLL